MEDNPTEDKSGGDSGDGWQWRAMLERLSPEDRELVTNKILSATARDTAPVGALLFVVGLAIGVVFMALIG